MSQKIVKLDPLKPARDEIGNRLIDMLRLHLKEAETTAFKGDFGTAASHINAAKESIEALRTIRDLR